MLVVFTEIFNPTMQFSLRIFKYFNGSQSPTGNTWQTLCVKTSAVLPGVEYVWQTSPYEKKH